MTLKDYIAAAGISQADFAIKCETTDATISRIVAGKLRPGLELAHRISRETKGKVPTETWLRVA